MSNRENILSRLTSSKFEEFIEGIEESNKYSAELTWDQELLERVLSVFIYHKAYVHDEITDAFTKIMNDFPAMAEELLESESADEDYFTKGQITGLTLFLYQYNQQILDISGFMMACGFIYQIAAGACRNVNEICDRNKWASVSEGLTSLENIFDSLWKTQMTAQGIISDVNTWNDDTVTAFNNIFNECDFESRSRMLRGLSVHAGNDTVEQQIVGTYRNTLEKIRDKKENKKENKKEAEPFIQLLEELNDLFKN